MPLGYLTIKARGLYRRLTRMFRKIHFSILSSNGRIEGRPNQYQPVFYTGMGSIHFEENINIGFLSSPGFWSGYCYLDSRSESSKISIGGGTWINNGFSAIAEKGSIKIGRDCLIGHNVFIIDSDFHDINPKSRKSSANVKTSDVVISENVFIGSNVIVLKGTIIGRGCVIGAGSVVHGVFPDNCLISGNPAKVTRTL